MPADALIFGAWDLTLDPAAATASLVPSRAGAVFGDSWWLNATGFLNGAPCTDCLTVESIRQDPEGHPLVTFRARHPFAPGDPGLPPTGANRLDLHVFDAQLLVVGDLGNTTASFGAGSVTAPSRLVLNPAGFSGALTSVASALNPSLTATVFPYVTLAEDRTPGNWLNSNPGGFADLQNPTGYNVFAMGADVTTEVTLGIEPLDGPVKLTLMFTASYGQSAVGRTNRLVPVYPLPEYNAKAPWKVAAEVLVATNALEAGNAVSTAELTVQVWDWQAGAVVDPTLNDIGAVRGTSEPATLIFALPGVLSAPLTIGAPVSGSGVFDDPLVYSQLFTNQAAADAGSYVGLIQVTDDRVTNLNAGGSPDALSSTDGTSIDPVNLAGFETYQIVTVTIAEGMTRTLLSIDIAPDTRQIIAQGAGEAITFTATGNYSQAPLTEDLTTTIAWDSSTLDVAIFGANVLTGIGMGTTAVTASLDTVTSDPTTVIVKPVQFLNLTGGGVTYRGVSANQSTGQVYIQTQQGTVRTHNDDGSFISAFPVVPIFGRTPALDTVGAGRVFVHETTSPPGSPVYVYDLSGVLITSYLTPISGAGPVQVHYDSAGRLWSSLWNAHQLIQIDPATGVAVTNPSLPIQLPNPSSIQGIDSMGDLLAVATPGGRTTGRCAMVVNGATGAILTTGGTENTANGAFNQNDHAVFDRDGYIHVPWNGQSGIGIEIQVYEYLPGDTDLHLLYRYYPTTSPTITNVTGCVVSRPNNVVVLNRQGANVSTWFQ